MLDIFKNTTTMCDIDPNLLDFSEMMKVRDERLAIGYGLKSNTYFFIILSKLTPHRDSKIPRNDYLKKKKEEERTQILPS